MSNLKKKKKFPPKLKIKKNYLNFKRKPYMNSPPLLRCREKKK